MNYLPDIKYYSPNFMEAGQREAFLKWYDEHSDDPFDFQH